MGGRGPKTELSIDLELLLCEILFHQAADAIRSTLSTRTGTFSEEPGLTVLVGGADFGEARFLEKAAGAPLLLGALDLQAQFFPGALWNVDRRRYLFRDDLEVGPGTPTVRLELQQSSLPESLLSALIQELSEMVRREEQPQNEGADQGRLSANVSVVREVYTRLTREGSNAYPRLAGEPQLLETREDNVHECVLRIPLAPSRYGIALVTERGIDTPTSRELKKSYILNSLAVRIAYVIGDTGKRVVEFHLRKGGANATYGDSWDVGAAGYIDPKRHRDPEWIERISPWQAAMYELSEELRIPSHELPYREHYYFFGVGRNWPTGQVDLLGMCDGHFAPDPLSAS